MNLSFVQEFCRSVGASVSEVITDAGDAEMLMDKWPEGYKILRRAAEGPAWQREQLQNKNCLRLYTTMTTTRMCEWGMATIRF